MNPESGNPEEEYRDWKAPTNDKPERRGLFSWLRRKRDRRSGVNEGEGARKQENRELERIISGVDDRDFLVDKHNGFGNAGMAELLFKELKSTSPEKYQEIIRRIHGRPMINLGCGPTPFAEIITAAAAGAERFIGVDKYHDGEQLNSIDAGWLRHITEWMQYGCGISPEEFDIDEIPVEYVKEDMLRYLSGLPDNSANIMMDNVDEAIIQGREYIGALYEEITRVTGKDGILFANHSVISGNSPSRTFIPILDAERYADEGGFSYAKQENDQIINAEK